MSQAVNANEKTIEAGEDMDTKQYYIVQQDSSGDAEVGESATDLLLGVLQNKPKSGEGALIRFAGTSKVVAAGSISVGAEVTSDAAGKAVTTTTDKDLVIGVALEASANDLDVIEIMLTHYTLSI